MRTTLALLALLWTSPLRAQVTPVMPSRSLTGMTVTPSTVSASQCLRADSAGTYFFAGPGCGSAEAVFNEASGDVDLRVESDGNANALFVDAGSNAVAIMTATPAAGAAFTSSGSLVAQSTSTTAAHFVLKVNNASATELMRVQQDGLLGIGVTNPTEFIHTSGNIRSNGGVFTAGTASAFLRSNLDVSVDMDFNNDETTRVFVITTNAGASELLRLQENGNLGVGTASPGSRFEVSGGSVVVKDTANALIEANDTGDAVRMRMWASSDGATWDTVTNHAAIFRTNSNEKMRIQAGGNVGVGTSVPATKLHMSSGTLTVDGNVTNSINVNGTVLSSRATDLGWSVVNAANQACNTTCTNACVFGMDTGALGNFLPCTDAAADTCICAGAN